MMKRIQTYFWLAILGHLLLFLSFTAVITLQPTPTKKMDLPLDTYIYHEEKNSPTSRPLLDNSAKEKITTSKMGIEKPMPQKARASQQAASQTISLGKGEQNINLTVKSKKTMDKPLLNILTKAVAAHLIYPKIAYDFHLTGTVITQFTISPDGKIAELSIARSSGTDVLDQAALDAVNAASPLKSVNFYLTKTEPFFFEIVFR